MNNQNSIIIWIKRLFSLQSFSVIIALVGVFLSYKTLVLNKESSISIEIYDPVNNEYIDIKENIFIMTIYNTIIEDDPIIDFVSGDKRNILLLPTIRNNSSKGLKNFRCDITISDFEFDFDIAENEEFISKDFQLLENNKYEFDTYLRYKGNVLHAQSELPAPLACWDRDEDDSQINLEYTISYDGLEEPIYIYTCLVINDKKNGYEYRNEDLEEYIERAIYPKIPSKYKKSTDKYVIVKTNCIREFNLTRGIIHEKPPYESYIDSLIREKINNNKPED